MRKRLHSFSNLRCRPDRRAGVWVLLLLAMVLTGNINSQSAANYAYTTSTTGSLLLDKDGNTVDMSTGTTQLYGAGVDTYTATLQNLGFTYIFMGVPYTQFSANPDGQIQFGSTLITGHTQSAALSTAKILALNTDNKTGATGKVHYKVQAGTGGQVLIIEWKDILINWSATGTTLSSYQLRLYEASGAIEMVYGQMWNSSTSAQTSSIGFSSSNTAGTVGQLTTINVTPTFNSSSTSYITTSFTASAAMTNLNSAADGSRTVFTFSPPAAPIAPTSLSFTGVGVSGMTLNWVDNSSNETGFLVYYSTDNVTFNYLATAAANATTYAASGLSSGTYYWRVYAVSEGTISTALTGSQATSAPSLSGTMTVGPTGTYASLTAAIVSLTNNGLAGSVLLELQPAYVSTVETFPLTFTNFAGLGSSNTLTIRPQSGATALSINGLAASTQVIDLNNADYVTFDGRPGGTGTARELTISSLNTSGQAVRLINDATNNAFRYVTIQGINTSTSSGVVLFSTTTGTTGNDNNTIDNCLLKDGSSTPTNLIYSAGSTGSTALNNSGNIISNNSISNFFSASLASAGILVSSGSTDWTISDNHLFQTATRTSTAGSTHVAISVLTGNNHTITGNYIGGSTTSAGGTAWTIAGGFANRFIGIQIANGTTTASSIQGNFVRNISLSSTSGATTAPGVFCGIYINAAWANVGTVTGNTIGAETGTGSISATISTSLGLSTGISIGGSSLGRVENNKIGSITLAGSTTSVAHNFVGIEVASFTASQTLTINLNLIGSLTTANSIRQSTAVTGTVSQGMTGIRIGSSNPVGVITSNTIANLDNAAVSSGSSTFVRGIAIGGVSSAHTITGNTIRNLSTASINVSGNVSAVLQGIATASTNSALPQSISNNVIHSLINTNTTAGVSVIGIVANWTSTTTTLTCSGNLVHSLRTSGLASSNLFGMYIGAGAATYANNMIRLGLDESGNSLTIGQNIAGINEFLGTNTIVHNSVYIGGTGVASSNNTFAFWAQQTSNTRVFRNNIFVNDRQNATGTAVNAAASYAGSFPNATGLTLDNNIYYSSNASTLIRNSVNNYTLSGWRTFSNADINSVVAANLGQINFVNATGNSSAVDLHVQGTTLAEGSGALISSITTDFDGQTRSGLTPVDIGADAGNFTQFDVFPPVITYTALSGTSSTSSRTLASVTITDNSGVNVIAGTAPRIYFKKSTDDNVFAGNTDADNGWKWVESTTGASPFTFTIDYSIIFGGGVTAGNVIQYFVVAQDLATTPNVGINSGSFATTPTDVDLAGAFPIGGTINSYPIVGSISGTFTVGATGATYTTIQNAINDVASKEMTGAVQLNLIDASYAETVSIPALTGSSATNTLTIKPTGTCAITTTSATAVINMSGSDYVIIDGSSTPGGSTRDLTITNSSTSTNSGVVWVTNNGTNGATNNTFKNLNLTGNASTTTFCGIGIGGSTIGATLGSGNNNNVIDNCNFTGSVYGIYTSGASASSKNTGTQIINNRILSGVGRFGIYVGFEDGVIIRNNQIGGITNSGSVDAFGITLGLNTITSTSSSGNEVTNATVTLNTITQVNQTATYSAAGIAVASATSGTTLIANNMVSGVASNGTSSDITAGIYLGGGAGTTTNVYHNSVWMNGAISGSTAGSTASFALAIVATSPIVDIRNNIFRNTQTPNTSGTTKFYAVGLSYTSTTGNYLNLTSDKNILDVASGAAYFVGITNGLTAGTTRLTIANWRTETGRDLSSQQVNPQFHSLSNLHVLPTSPSNNAGDDLTSVVSVDYDGEARSTTPDIGADEFVGMTASASGSLTSPTLSSYTALFALTNSGGVEINPTSYSTGATFTAQYFGSGRTGSVPVGVLNLSPYFWTLTTDASSFNVAIRFYFDQIASNGVVDFNSLRLYRRAGTGNTWTEITAGLTKTATYIEVSGLTSFSEFAFGGDVDNPLPVELVNFQAKAKNRNAILSWETKTEVDNSGFEVERIDEDGDWKKVTFIEGHGTSNSTKYYSFEDKKLSSGKHSYRLKQIDNDGTVNYSDIVEVEISLPTEFALSQNYPNPFNPSTKVDYQLAADSRVTIELYGITGERVAVLVNQEQEAGYYTMMIDSYTHRMASGIYIYRMIATDATGKNFVSTKKLSLLK